jgi:FMN phosphatase YigB (HAD superfamily)
MSERPVIVFDVNETLLDLDSIRPVFDRIFGDPAAMRLWFANLITYSEALTLAGVIDLFESRFSVDEAVKRHKPAQEAYQSVAAALELEPGNICLIANHVWDTIGAGAAGWQTALILREGNAPLDVGPQPDYIGKDLDAIADRLMERYPATSGLR